MDLDVLRPMRVALHDGTGRTRADLLAEATVTRQGWKPAEAVAAQARATGANAMAPAAPTFRVSSPRHAVTPPDPTPVLAADPTVRLAVVFGSVARGEAGPDSDLDVGVMGSRPLTPDQIAGLTRALAMHTGRPVDLVDLRAAHGALPGAVRATGVRVVERDPVLFPALLSRHLAETADVGPLRARLLADRRRAWTAASS